MVGLGFLGLGLVGLGLVGLGLVGLGLARIVWTEDLLERSHGFGIARGRERLDVHGIKPAQSLDDVVVEVAAKIVSRIRAVTVCHVCLLSCVRLTIPQIVMNVTLRDGRRCCRSGLRAACGLGAP